MPKNKGGSESTAPPHEGPAPPVANSGNKEGPPAGKTTIRKPVVLLVIVSVIVFAMLTAILMVILTNDIIADSVANYVYQAQIRDLEQVKRELQSQMQTRLTWTLWSTFGLFLVIYSTAAAYAWRTIERRVSIAS